MKKFTLIELLIVVSIIGILVSLLLPSIMKARERGKRAVCISNNHQLYLALDMYQQDFQSMPPGNATISKGHGIDSTYWVKGKRPMGLAILNTAGYIEGGGVFYCPSWNHPDKDYGVIDFDGSDVSFGTNQFGGWPLNEKNDPWPTEHVGISYHYRSSFGTNSDQAARLMLYDAAATAINADHWTRREKLFGQDYGHFDAYGTLYLDGHVKMIHDNKASYMNAKQPGTTYTHGNWAFQESVWKDFFDWQ